MAASTAVDVPSPFRYFTLASVAPVPPAEAGVAFSQFSYSASV